MIEDTKTYSGHTYSGLQLSACVDGYNQALEDIKAIFNPCKGCEVCKSDELEKEKEIKKCIKDSCLLEWEQIQGMINNMKK